MNHIYFFYDKDLNLLYIGKTTSLPQRMSAHFSKSAVENTVWKKDVDLNNIVIHRCPTKTDLDIYETYLINKLKPLYNKDKVFYEKPTVELPELNSTAYMYRPYKESRRINLAFLDYIDLKDSEIKTEEMLLIIQNLELEFPHFIGDYSTEKKEEVLEDRIILETVNSFPEEKRHIYVSRLDMSGSHIKFDARTNQYKWK